MTQDHRRSGATPVPHDLFEAELFPERERFDVWRESVLPLFESRPEDSPGVFHARVESFDLRALFFARSEFSPLNFHRARRHCIPDTGDPFLVQLYTRGGYVGYNGDRPVCVEAGDISLLDLGRTLETCAPASANVSLAIPRELLAEWLPNANLRHGTVLRGNSPVGRILGHHLLAVWEALPDASVNDIESINRTLLGAVAGAFHQGRPPQAATRAVSGAVTLDAIRVFIHRHLDSDRLSPALLCRHFGCSRSRLYRLFEPLGGIAGYIRRLRLERCRHDLNNADARTRVVDIALRWGFDNQSHFSRLFRQAFELSPSEALARGRERNQRETAAATGDFHIPAFHDWLRRF